MRIYYFGELIEDTNETKKKQEAEAMQTALDLEAATPKKLGMDSIGDLLKELDLNLDSFRPNGFRTQKGV